MSDKTREDKLKKEIRGITIRDLMEEARSRGRLEGKNEIMEKIIESKLKIELRPKLRLHK